jgi:NitT/TauT family transport system substrate-binding protein
VLADRLGYFAEEGLDIEFFTFDSAARMVAPLGAGHLDVGGGAPSAGLYNAVARGVNISIVADKGQLRPGYGYMPLLVRKELVDSGEVADAGDLVGRTVAEPAPGTATSSTLDAMLEARGAGYDDVDHSFLRFPEHATALGNGAVDAAVTTEPSATLAEQRGVAVRLQDSTQDYPGQQLAVLLYSQDFVADRPEVGDCFMRSYLRGARTYLEAVPGGTWTGPRAQELSAMLSGTFGMDPELLRRITPTYMDPNGGVDVASLRRDYDFFAERGSLEDTVQVEQLVDTSFARRAVDELGPVPGRTP